MTNAESQPVRASRLHTWAPVLCFALISLIFFADICLRASRKCFWYDELFTVYLCRLPDFRSTWDAVMHGVDFNPPLFYLLIRWSQRLLGEGLIVTRLPAMVGVWLFCVSLFLFVNRRAGAVAGCIAGLFPFFTLAQYYAYEARPHGIVLGWIGLALVCWQRAGEGSRRHLWVAGFGFSLLAALLTHVYAVYSIIPFVLIEIYRLWKERRVKWGILAAIVLSLALVFPVYLPMSRQYRSMTLVGGLPGSPQDVLQHFVLAVFGPAMVLLLLTLVLFALAPKRPIDPAPAGPRFPQREILLAAAFACIPLIGMVGVRLSHGPFFERYFLPSVAGFAIFLGFAASRWPRRSRVAQVLAACMFMLMLGDLGTAVFHRIRHSDFGLVEPSSKLDFAAAPDQPLSRDLALVAPHPPDDILVLEDANYLYLYRYAPAALRSHLYFGARTVHDPFLIGYDRLARWAHLDLQMSTFDPFLAGHTRFLVYASADGLHGPPCGGCAETFLQAGYGLKSVHRDTDGILYEYEK